MVDQHRLLLPPVGPALPTYLGYDPRADLPREWGLVESLARLSTTRAVHRRHLTLRARVLDLREPEEGEQSQIHPPNVELVPPCLELGRMGICVVVVVKFLSA